MRVSEWKSCDINEHSRTKCAKWNIQGSVHYQTRGRTIQSPRYTCRHLNPMTPGHPPRSPTTSSATGCACVRLGIKTDWLTGNYAYAQSAHQTLRPSNVIGQVKLRKNSRRHTWAPLQESEPRARNTSPTSLTHGVRMCAFQSENRADAANIGVRTASALDPHWMALANTAFSGNALAHSSASSARGPMVESPTLTSHRLRTCMCEIQPHHLAAGAYAYTRVRWENTRRKTQKARRVSKREWTKHTNRHTHARAHTHAHRERGSYTHLEHASDHAGAAEWHFLENRRREMVLA